ncbi:MAG: alpha/beta hydrolase [Burkholderiaceae bacterium]|nr:alpha/beta hydrolase [Burkholderiaceae bacterium]MCD8564533.1 alpha/beta hydrolase [Burkholderiaceae bacterium]
MQIDVSDISKALEKAAALPALNAQLERLESAIALQGDGVTLWQCHPTNHPKVTIEAPTSVWLATFEPVPKPGFQSLGALYRLCDSVKIEADTKAFMQALPILELMIENARQLINGSAIDIPIDDNLKLINGRYTNTASGWLYTEESGDPNGEVICMLHTAGADARQWHGLMTNDELQSWRMLAFDMPNHGRSPVRDDQSQWQWQLDEASYVKTVHDFIKATTNKPVVLMGCSMGAAIGIALLAQYPELFKAAILLETPYHSPGRRTPYLDHPQVHGGRLAATWVASLLSPKSPQSRRNLARWIYSQSGPGVYDGDLRFYSDEFSATRHTSLINTTKTPVWLLTGDYDYSASPSDTQKVANEINGATFIEMKGFGHFPMTEDPARLYETYLRSILRAI